MTSPTQQARVSRCDPEDPLYHFGDVVRARRVELGLTSRAFAKSLGVTPWTIRNWERGPHNFGSVVRVLAKIDRKYDFRDVRTVIKRYL